MEEEIEVLRIRLQEAESKVSEERNHKKEVLAKIKKQMDEAKIAIEQQENEISLKHSKMIEVVEISKKNEIDHETEKRKYAEVEN